MADVNVSSLQNELSTAVNALCYVNMVSGHYTNRMILLMPFFLLDVNSAAAHFYQFCCCFPPQAIFFSSRLTTYSLAQPKRLSRHFHRPYTFKYPNHFVHFFSVLLIPRNVQTLNLNQMT